MVKIQEKALKPSIIKYFRQKDKKGRHNGDGEARYSNGSVVWGTFKHAVREGPATIEQLNSERIDGVFVNDKLEGWAIETYNDSGWRQTYYRRGVQVGYYRDISACGCYLEFGTVGGRVWRVLDGKAMMVGDTDSQGRFTGSDVIYLYPGFGLAIVGSFEQGKMKNGRECVPVYVDYDDTGLPYPVVKVLKHSRLLEYESPGTHVPAKNCSLRDLWDVLHVYVAPSKVEFAGEGLFARRKIKKGSLVAVFNGSRKRQFRQSLVTEEFSDYCIKVDTTVSLDIPDFYIPVKHYSATLAHKVKLCISELFVYFVVAGMPLF